MSNVMTNIEYSTKYYNNKRVERTRRKFLFSSLFQPVCVKGQDEEKQSFLPPNKKKLSNKLNDKCDVFSFRIVNFAFSMTIPLWSVHITTHTLCQR